MVAEEPGKTETEKSAERVDSWKMARSLLRNSDMRYEPEDVCFLADWIAGKGMVDIDD